jgi:hypothetical protein
MTIRRYAGKRRGAPNFLTVVAKSLENSKNGPVTGPAVTAIRKVLQV